MKIKYYSSNFLVIITVTLSIVILLFFGLSSLSTFADNYGLGFLIFGLVFTGLGIYQFVNWLSLVRPKKITLNIENNTLYVKRFLFKKSFEIHKIKKCEITLSERIKDVYSIPKGIKIEYDIMKYTMLDFFGINRGITLIIQLEGQKFLIPKISVRCHKDLLQLKSEIIKQQTIDEQFH